MSTTELKNIPRGDKASVPSMTEDTRSILSEASFKRMIMIERKRTERTNEPFLLMLIEGANRHNLIKYGRLLDSLIVALLPATRDTDIIGWYQKSQTIGVLFTGLPADAKGATRDVILTRMREVLRNELEDELLGQISISLQFYPDDWNEDGPGGPTNLALYPDLSETSGDMCSSQGVKRVLDMLGSALLLLIMLPIFALVAAAVKFTSKGPIFFRQQRVGQFGRCFTFLKFRTMTDGNDNSAHKEYVKQLIAGKAKRKRVDGRDEGVYKLANDPRITPIGKFLRRTSLDELPQLLNVLKGEMSLVGPRPPIPYELAAYQTWHRSRVLQLKPGITGLWQVTGRSRVSFDEMVRLDLRYTSAWTLWLDIKILARTPAAVIRGAY